ncbi:MAG: TldD/PmbA family protein [Candidatus Sericytochromatia bacterium]|nr:TldD/PmbA family protein [Candidatus Sericytochromatia bacterium]
MYGVEYADIRIEDLKHENISIRNKKIENLNYSESIGFGIKVLYKGCWGFASSSILKKEEINKTVEQAINIAKASAIVKKDPVILSPLDKIIDRYTSPFEIDPFKVPLADKLKLLISACEVMSSYKEINVSEAELNFYKHKKIFANSDGSYIEQEFIKSGAGIQVWAVKDNEMQTRSYPANSGGDFRNSGYEFVLNMNLTENADIISQEAIKLLTAEQCPSGQKTLILDSNQMAIQIHESIGHPIEYDRVLGMEASFAGTSFLTPEKLNKLVYGSNIINVFADATIPYALGSFAYDDEGVKAQRVPIIDQGLFVGYLTSRETSPNINKNSMGSTRAENWNFLPIIRMTNINLEPGSWELDDLIADTEDGIYMKTNKSWSIDDKRWNFQFATEIAWEIKNGKLGKIYKNPTYTDNTVHFWNSCDAICNEKSWHIWGVPNCGKGQPMQTGHVGHGSSPARFRNIRTGIL